LKNKLLLLIILFSGLAQQNAFAQYPQFFVYNDENGLPSNEVYSIIQDERGFIWIGCDAGLFKFDGMRYIQYKCATQKSKSISGLTISSSGKLFCDNFQSQIFFVENDTLKELKHSLSGVSHIVCDYSENLYVNHQSGLAVYNESQMKWNNFKQFGEENSTLIHKHFTKSARVNKNNEVYFLTGSGIGTLRNNDIKIIPYKFVSNDLLKDLLLVLHNEEAWSFSVNGNLIFKVRNGISEIIDSKDLNNILQGRKITNLKTLSDGKLWICTYKGIIRYDLGQDKAELFYPEMSFSDCLIDRENNYWFSTLQSGLIRIPNLQFVVWNKENQMLSNDRLTKISTDNTHVYFSTVNGVIGKLNTFTNQLSTFHTGFDADAQCLNYDFEDKCLYFNINQQLFQLSDDVVKKKSNAISSIKYLKKINGLYFIGSSFGTFIQHDLEVETPKVYNSWTREVEFDSTSNIAWVATNDGLLKFEQTNNNWTIANTYLPETQIISTDFDKQNKLLYILTYNSKIFSVNNTGNVKELLSLPENIQPYEIKQNDNNIYIATNKGVWIYDLKEKNIQQLDVLSGLASNNVQDLTIVNNSLWLATGKGLQKIPLSQQEDTTRAIIYLKGNYGDINNWRLKYGKPIVLQTEVSSYRSNKNYSYAYRMNQNDEWTKLPAEVEQIEIQNLPTGNFEINLKAIDHLGRDSENTIVISGFIEPPFWQTWWFMAIFILAVSATAFLILKNIISNIRKREQEKTALISSELTALKAQMNPHFMYNALNSIQALILKHDIKNSNLYLVQFSNLMRKVLDVSGEDEISIKEETEILQLYLSLEKLRFGNEFSYEITVSKNIDSYKIGIPPLIVQPFAENAVKHGLLHKKGEKKLTIEFELENNSLICKITDNGIGRNRAQQIKERQQDTHKSFSTHATFKRVQLLNNVKGQNIELEIVDLYKNQLASGTQVIIKIPIQSNSEN
jgi:ligand-binding sensor domain-containing protein/anti-sigma regulatory factor (Ser/Thr protein kinase)